MDVDVVLLLLAAVVVTSVLWHKKNKEDTVDGRACIINMLLLLVPRLRRRTWRSSSTGVAAICVGLAGLVSRRYSFLQACGWMDGWWVGVRVGWRRRRPHRPTCARGCDMDAA